MTLVFTRYITEKGIRGYMVLYTVAELYSIDQPPQDTTK